MNDYEGEGNRENKPLTSVPFQSTDSNERTVKRNLRRRKQSDIQREKLRMEKERKVKHSKADRPYSRT